MQARDCGARFATAPAACFMITPSTTIAAPPSIPRPTYERVHRGYVPALPGTFSCLLFLCLHVYGFVYMCVCVFSASSMLLAVTYTRAMYCVCFVDRVHCRRCLHANEYQQCQCYPSLRVPDFPLSQMVPPTSRLLLLLNLMCVLLLLYRYQWGVSHPYFYWVYENRLDEISANWVRTLFFLRTKFIV